MFAVHAPQLFRPAAAKGSRWAMAVAMATFACCAGAQSTEVETAQLASADLPATQFEVLGTSLPRFDSSENATQTNRIDISLMPAGRSGIGLAMGVTSLSGSRWNSLAPARAGMPSVNVGLQWRYTLDSNYRIDVTAWRRLPNTDAMSLIESREPSYGARVEMGLGRHTRTKGFTADKGFLGFQLESGARISVKRKNGGPMFYYRNTF